MPAFHIGSMWVERTGVTHIIKLLVVDMAAAPWDCLVGRAIITIAIGRGCAQGQLLHFRSLRGAEQAAGCLLGGGAWSRLDAAWQGNGIHSIVSQCLHSASALVRGDDAINSCSLWGLDRPQPDS